MVDEYQDTNRPQYLLDPPAGRSPPQPVRRRRSRSVDLQVARRRSAGTSSTSSTTFPKRRSSSSNATTARRRSSSTPRRPSSARTGTARTSICGPTARAATRIVVLPRRRRARGSGLHHARRPARSLADDVDAMVAVLYRDQRAVANDRRRADARGRRLQGHRRRPVLRAQGDQGRARLHAARHQPARRREPAAGDQRAGARHRQGRHGRRSRTSTPAADDRPTCRCSRAGLQPALSANSLWARIVRGLDERRVSRPRRRIARRRFAT